MKIDQKLYLKKKKIYLEIKKKTFNSYNIRIL